MPAGAVLKGVSMRDSLCAVLDFIVRSRERFDHVVVTGDLVHDGHVDSYRAARSCSKVAWDGLGVIPGNHDDRARWRARLPDAASTAAEFIAFSMESAGWRLIGLDTLDHGNGFGRVSPAHLDWLRDELSRNASGSPRFSLCTMSP